MPDPNAKRDRSLEAIARALDAQTKIYKAVNENIVQLGTSFVPAMASIQQFFDAMNEQEALASGKSLGNSWGTETHWDCTPEACKVAHADPEFDYEDCPKRGTLVEYISVVLDPLSTREVEEAGYTIETSNVGSFIRIPRLKENPNAT